MKNLQTGLLIISFMDNGLAKLFSRRGEMLQQVVRRNDHIAVMR